MNYICSNRCPINVELNKFPTILKIFLGVLSTMLKPTLEGVKKPLKIFKNLM